MQCSNCQKEFTKGTICPSCNVDPILYAGTVRLSDKLYNKGLEKLINGDLTQGIELLNRSVYVNKNNVTARNLLGLALFEIGYVGDALKHWVISQSLQKDDNTATRYVEEARKNARALEQLNDSAVKYNQALTYLNQKSDDLAIIQLKRAVELNPRFVDALNLLALCHLIQNDREKAAAAAERVLAIDIQNPIALNYLSVLAPNRARTDTRKGTRQASRREPTASKVAPSFTRPTAVQEKRPRTFRFDIILAFVLGAAMSFAVVYLMLFPAIHASNASEITNYRARLEEAADARIRDAEAHDEELAAKQRIVDDIQVQMDAMEADFELQDRMIRFNNLDRLFRDDTTVEGRQAAMEQLYLIDLEGFHLDMVIRADEMRATAYPQIYAHHMGEGTRAYAANDPLRAMVAFETALRFATEDSPRPAEFLFAMGSMLEHDESRHPEAREYLEELAARFPNHRPITRNQILGRLTD